MQRHAAVGQQATQLGVACECGGLVVVVGVDRLHAQPGGQRRYLVGRPAVAHDQPGALDAVRGRERTQFGVDADQAVAYEFDAAVLPGQGVEDVAVEDEDAPDLARGAQCVVQCGVVVGAQVAAQPDQGAVQRAWRGVGRGFVHGP